MEAKEWVLVSKSDDNLYVHLYRKLTRHGRPGRCCWEFTENFNDATGFRNYDHIADELKRHRCPFHILKLRPYTNAFSTWLQKTSAPETSTPSDQQETMVFYGGTCSTESNT